MSNSNLQRRVRSLEILDDLQTLAALGVDIDPHPGSNQALMLESYRHNARIGEFDHLRQFIDPAAVSVDVGANIGQYALKLAAESRQCVVIEPNEKLAWLAEALPSNCIFVKTAAGSAEGQGTLTIPLHDGEVQFALATLGDYFDGEIVESQAVPVRTLDGILNECCSDERVGFIKIDVEGSETAVVAGAQQTISRWRPNMQVEIWQESVPRTADLFASLGYRGLFFFGGRMLDISRFDAAVHTAPENAWRRESPEHYDPDLFVNNFFFVPH